MDRAIFFDAIRKSRFGGRLKDSQVQNIEIILDEATSRDVPLRHLAYILATTNHEVGSSMAPVRENLNYRTATQIRKTWPTRFRTNAAAAPYVKNPQGLANKVYGGRMGNNTQNDGWTYRGGGYPQTTGKENYAESGKLVGIDLVSFPNRILEPRIAAVTMIISMVRGLYTGKKLSDFINDQKQDYRGARAIINSDVAKNGSAIADYALNYQEALQKAGYGISAPAIKVPAPEPQPKPEPAPAPAPDPVVKPQPSRPIEDDDDEPTKGSKTDGQTWLVALWSFLGMFFKRT